MCLCVRVSFSLLSLARSLLSLSPALPSSPLSLPLLPLSLLLPPPAPFPLRGSLAAALAPAPLSSAPGSALGLPGGWRSGARERGDALQRRRLHGGGSGGGGGAGNRGHRGEPSRRLPRLNRPPFLGLTCCLGRKLTGSPGYRSGSNPPKRRHPPPPRAALPTLGTGCALQPPLPLPPPPAPPGLGSLGS